MTGRRNQSNQNAADRHGRPCGRPPYRGAAIRQVLIALVGVAALLACLFPQGPTSLAYANSTNGSQNCPGNTNSQNDGSDCENESGCTNEPDPESTVEDVDRWASTPAIDVPSDLKIAGPTVVCVGKTASYGFDRSGQSDALDHGVADDDTHFTGTETTYYKVDDSQPDCPTVPDYIDDDNVSDTQKTDGISYTWSASDGTIQKNSQGYGDFTAPGSGGTVTIKTKFSDGAPTVSKGERDDADNDDTDLTIKIVEVSELKPDEGQSAGYSEGTDPGYVDAEVWEIPIDNTSGATFNVVASPNDLTPYITDDDLYDAGCWSVQAYEYDYDNGLRGDPTGTSADIRTVTLPQTDAGWFLVIATAGTSEKRVLAKVEEGDLEKLQYKDPTAEEETWVDAGDKLHVVKGTAVTFRAVKVGDGEWGENEPGWSGTSGVNGTGEQKTVTFNTVGADKTVIAEAGNKRTTKVTVVEITPTMTPGNNFAGHAVDKLAIKEVSSVGFTTNPAGVSSSDLGGLRWALTNNVGMLILANSQQKSGEGTYIASSTANAPNGNNPTVANLKVEVLDGPSRGKSVTLNLTIVPPSGITLARTAGLNKFHQTGMASVGVKIDKFVQPDDVDFSNIQIREETCNPQLTGWFISHGEEEVEKRENGQTVTDEDGDPVMIKRKNQELMHVPGSHSNVRPPTAAGVGSLAQAVDTAEGKFVDETPDPYADGTLTWNIPVAYSSDGGQTWTEFATAVQIFTITSTGKLTVEKQAGGTSVSVSAEKDDPTSVYQGSVPPGM